MENEGGDQAKREKLQVGSAYWRIVENEKPVSLPNADASLAHLFINPVKLKTARLQGHITIFGCWKKQM